MNSERSFTDVLPLGDTAGETQHNVYVMGPVLTQSKMCEDIPHGEVWVDKKLMQTSEIV